jgi:hypothetical protein
MEVPPHAVTAQVWRFSPSGYVGQPNTATGVFQLTSATSLDALPGKADIVRDTVASLLRPTGQSFTGHVGGHCQILAFHKVTIEARPTLDAFAICVQNTPCPSPKPEGEHMA